MDTAPLILTPAPLPIVTADPIDVSAVHFGTVLLNLGLELTPLPWFVNMLPSLSGAG